MEYLKGIIRSIATDTRIANEQKVRQRSKSKLEKYVGSDAGRKHLQRVLHDLHIEEQPRTAIITIDNDLREFRLAVQVGEDVFRDILRSKKPETIQYMITHMNDTADSGYLLLEVDDKVVMRTSGILFPQASGIKGVLSDLFPDLPYVPIETEARGFQPWRKMTLKKT